MLAELSTTNKEWIVTFHEHDSLLENMVEQELSEEEKKAAWEDYENDKKGLNNGKLQWHVSISCIVQIEVNISIK